MVSAVALGFQKLDTWRAFAKGSQLFDLVFRTSDPGFIHLHQPQLFALVDRNAADDVDDPLAILQTPPAELLEGDPCGGDRRVGIGKDPMAARCRGCPGRTR